MSLLLTLVLMASALILTGLLPEQEADLAFLRAYRSHTEGEQ